MLLPVVAGMLKGPCQALACVLGRHRLGSLAWRRSPSADGPGCLGSVDEEPWRLAVGLVDERRSAVVGRWDVA